MVTSSFVTVLLFCLTGWTTRNAQAYTCQENCERSRLAQIWRPNVLQQYCKSRCRNAQTNKQPSPTTRPTTRLPYYGVIRSRPQELKLISRRCGLQPPRDRIVGGDKARACEYPWVVAVNVTDRFCGGSILDSRHILTAAHCVKTTSGRLLNATDVMVLIGSSRLRDTIPYSVAHIRAHPDHSDITKDYDVAVLTLHKTITETCAAAICLPEAIPDVRETDNCVVAGWGSLAYASNEVSPDLRAVRVPLVNQNTCATRYRRFQETINDLKLCLGDYFNGGVDACRGDSGGPFMCYRQGVWHQFGIVSFGMGCAVPYFPGVYTRVSHLQILQFIRSAMRY